MANLAPLQGEFSLTVSRALSLLCLFDEDRRELGVSELSRALKLSKPAVQRLLHALQMHQFVEQNFLTRKYRVGVAAFRVGRLFAGAHDIERLALPLMHDVMRQTGMTCYLSVMRDEEMLIVAAVEGEGPIRHSIPVGGRLPLHCSAVGKAALSALADDALGALLKRLTLTAHTPHSITDRARLRKDIKIAASRGYSVNWEENNIGVASIGAPIRNGRGELAAVLSVGFATSQITRSDVMPLGRSIARAAGEISHMIGASRSAA